MNASIAIVGMASTFIVGAAVTPTEPTEGQAWTLIGVLCVTMLGLLRLLQNLTKSIDKFTGKLGAHTERIRDVAETVENNARDYSEKRDEAVRRVIDEVPRRTLEVFREDERRNGGKRDAS